MIPKKAYIISLLSIATTFLFIMCDNIEDIDTGHPKISTSKTSYTVTENIIIIVANMPGGSKDWVGIYEADSNNNSYKSFKYIKKNGTIDFGTLPVGNYEARVFLNGTYNLEASIAFTVEIAWSSLFKGVDHVVLVKSAPLVNVLRIDLYNPDIRFKSTPSNGDAPLETNTQRTSDFLTACGVQVAINANFNIQEGNTANLLGLAISDGVLVSPGQGIGGQPSAFEEMLISSNNVVTYNHDPDKRDLNENVWTAVAGETLIYYGTVWGHVNSSHPRTALGISEDGRYLYMITADGRQSYDGVWYEGVTTLKIGEWLQKCGAYMAISLDGGGSSTMVMDNGIGGSTQLNTPIDEGILHRERYVGNNLGVYALPCIK